MECAPPNYALHHASTSGISLLQKCLAPCWELIFCGKTLLVDLKGKRLVDAETYLSIPLRKAGAAAPHLDAISAATEPYGKLLTEFTYITMSNSPNHAPNMVWNTSSPSVHARAHRLPPDKLATAKAEFNRMQSMGIICRSSSLWACPLHV